MITVQPRPASDIQALVSIRGSATAASLTPGNVGGEVTMAKKQPLMIRIVRVPSADAPHAQREAAKLLGQHLGELWLGDATTVTRSGFGARQN